MSRRIFQSVLGVALTLALAPAAHAQATRTWVSGVGDDVNPCSRTAPCKTFAGAISKTANGGFINVLDSGGFGTVTITKSITIDGDGAHAGVLGSLTNGIVVNGAGIRVTLRNLSIESGSVTSLGMNGIRVLQAAEVTIENVWIGNFSNTAIDFQPTGGGEGYINNVTLINNAGGGVVVNTGRVVVSNLRANSNGNGVMVNGNAIATVRNSYAAGGGAGFGATTTASAVINIENCTTTHNQFGIFAASGATVRVSDSMIVSNVGTGLHNDGTASLISLQGNEVIGNPTPGSFTSTTLKQ